MFSNHLFLGLYSCSWENVLPEGGRGVLFFSYLLFWSYVIQYLCHTFLLYSTSTIHICHTVPMPWLISQHKYQDSFMHCANQMARLYPCFGHIQWCGILPTQRRHCGHKEWLAVHFIIENLKRHERGWFWIMHQRSECIIQNYPPECLLKVFIAILTL